MAAPNLSDQDLLRIQLRTLFRLDSLGRLVPPSPRVFVGGATGERLVRIRGDIHESTSRRWLRCVEDAELRELVEAHAPITNEYRGPAYVLPELAPPADAVEVRPGIALHPELAARGWMPAEQPPYVGVVRDGVVVAVCFSARSTAAAAEAGVETVESYRGQGLGTVAVARWAAAVQASNRLALYSTTWDNLASQRVAAHLGAREYGEDWHLT